MYLQKEVGTALAKGLAAVTAAQPYDPVDYLAKWLLQYVSNQEQDKLVCYTQYEFLNNIKIIFKINNTIPSEYCVKTLEFPTIFPTAILYLQINNK